MGTPNAVIFDVGKVLFEWDPRYLYERLIEDDQALEAFLANVVTREWHFQHDAGRPFAETSAELSAQYPEHESLIAAWGPRFNETIPHAVPGMPEIVRELDAAGVPLFAITNFSADFWPPFHDRERAFFRSFRAIIVSGEVKLLKPDPAIYYLALDRFGLKPAEALFVDDRLINVEGALAVGMRAHLFTGAADLRSRLEAEALF